MAYLRLKDYYPYIQASNLQQVTRNDDSLRLQMENGAQTKITEYLVQKYDLAQEFTDTKIYSPIATYNAGQLVDLNFTAYNAGATYAVGDTATINGLGYICTTAITAPETFDPTHWQLLGGQYDLHFIPYPYPEFNYQTFYNLNDRVFWKGKVYQAAKGSIGSSHQAQLNAGTYQNLQGGNVFPGTPEGLTMWGVGVAYSFFGLNINALPTDFTAWSNVTTYTTGNRINYNSQIWQALKNNTNITPDSDITAWQPVSWVSGDNRNSDIMECYIDICLYKLHKGIAPQNIPDLRVKAFDDAIMWLDKCADGRITLDITKLQPIHGNKIRYGGNVKKINDY